MKSHATPPQCGHNVIPLCYAYIHNHGAPISRLASDGKTSHVELHTQKAELARGGLMVRNFDSYAYACGFESGLGTVRTGPLASLLTLSFFVLSRQCLKMRVLGVDVET